MIRSLPKPRRDYPIQLKKQRLPGRSRMTLALAMVCDNGLMLAADTRMSYQDGLIAEAPKITGFQTSNVTGTYIIVHSAQDANAANSLIGDIQQGLEDNRFPENLPSIEATIKNEMQKWYVPIHDARPFIQLLIGAAIQGQSRRILYLCEPPNTVARVYENYKAIGEGYGISDPIYKWFEDRFPWSPHACLCQISYMMYRAKKLLPGSIGGNTDVALLTDAPTVPFWINRLDMASAEAYGINFDRYLSNVASVIVGKNPEGVQEILKTAEGRSFVQSSVCPPSFPYPI